MSVPGLWCVILAAGASHRLGRPKQLIARRGRALLLHATATARSIAPARTVVVLGAHSLRLRALLARHDARVSVVVNPKWRSGMASSLIAGVRALPPEARAVLLMLSDQPNVGPRSLRRLVTAWRTRPGAPAAAYFSGEVGAPAILPRRYWPRIENLSGDVGARALLRHAGVRTTTVAMPEAELDIDTDQDLERL